MPYEIKQSSGGWKVFKKGTSKSFSKKPLSKSKAKAQMNALYANESFEQKLYNVLIEGRGTGHDTTSGNIPAEFDPNETEVQIEFDWADPEPKTHDYPGSPGGIDITRVITTAGKELNLDQIPRELGRYLESAAEDYLENQYHHALADREDEHDRRRISRMTNTNF